MEQQYETLKLELREDGILIVSLNRPDKYNALNRKMVDELNALWDSLHFNSAVKVVVLRGEGEKGFCGGLEVADTWSPDTSNGRSLLDFQIKLGKIELSMRQIPQPIVCAVHGAAVGAGFMFALASDIRVMSADARFSAAFINIGVGGADMGSSYFLTRLIPAGRAYDLMLTGRFMKADEAMQLGLVSQVVERDQLLEAALGIAQHIASKDPFVVQLTKEAINANMDCAGLEAALTMENRNQPFIVLNHLYNTFKG